MEELHITKIVKMGNSLGIIIPSNILKGYKWERGDRLIFGMTADNVLSVKRPSDKEFKELKKIKADGDYSVKADGSLIKTKRV